MKIYLDNCCFNRPYDDQSQLNISLETQAKLRIQDLIQREKLDLVTSYMLDYENSKNPFAIRRKTVKDFWESYESVYVSERRREDAERIASGIMRLGVKYKDACHVACAIIAECDYFISTDYRLLRLRDDSIMMMNPVEFVMRLEETSYGFDDDNI